MEDDQFDPSSDTELEEQSKRSTNIKIPSEIPDNILDEMLTFTQSKTFQTITAYLRESVDLLERSKRYPAAQLMMRFLAYGGKKRISFLENLGWLLGHGVCVQGLFWGLLYVNQGASYDVAESIIAALSLELTLPLKRILHAVVSKLEALAVDLSHETTERKNLPIEVSNSLKWYHRMLNQLNPDDWTALTTFLERVNTYQAALQTPSSRKTRKLCNQTADLRKILRTIQLHFPTFPTFEETVSVATMKALKHQKPSLALLNLARDILWIMATVSTSAASYIFASRYVGSLFYERGMHAPLAYTPWCTPSSMLAAENLPIHFNHKPHLFEAGVQSILYLLTAQCIPLILYIGKDIPRAVPRLSNIFEKNKFSIFFYTFLIMQIYCIAYFLPNVASRAFSEGQVDHFLYAQMAACLMDPDFIQHDALPPKQSWLFLAILFQCVSWLPAGIVPQVDALTSNINLNLISRDSLFYKENIREIIAKTPGPNRTSESKKKKECKTDEKTPLLQKGGGNIQNSRHTNYG